MSLVVATGKTEISIQPTDFVLTATIDPKVAGVVRADSKKRRSCYRKNSRRKD